MKKTIYILLVVVLLLGGAAAALWLPPANVGRRGGEHRFGLHEGLELVYKPDSLGDMVYVVEDADGNQLFSVPLRNCVIDTRYRGGRLRFREDGTGREGFVDREGNAVFFNRPAMAQRAVEARGDISMPRQTPAAEASSDGGNTLTAHGNGGMTDAELRRVARNNPFYKEAANVLSGRLSVEDGNRRRVILNYCEHLRAAYNTKDIDFIKQIFSENALIVVGNVVKAGSREDDVYMQPGRARYNVRTKREYIARLGKAFADNNTIDVKFSGFRIMRHPTMDGIYGVVLRQRYKSDRYSDDGYLFLLWDFRDESMPCIHVRTWQPSSAVGDDNDIISMGDFNLE